MKAMKKLCVILVLALVGCGVDTAGVDSRCKAGAPCNTMDVQAGEEYFNTSLYGLEEKLAGMQSGDPQQYWLKLFEAWYYEGVY